MRSELAEEKTKEKSDPFILQFAEWNGSIYVRVCIGVIVAIGYINDGLCLLFDFNFFDLATAMNTKNSFLVYDFSTMLAKLCSPC